jgi:hypothetical protein
VTDNNFKVSIVPMKDEIGPDIEMIEDESFPLPMYSSGDEIHGVKKDKAIKILNKQSIMRHYNLMGDSKESETVVDNPNEDANYIWACDMDGIVLFRMTKDMVQDSKVIQKRLDLLISLSRLVTNLCNKNYNGEDKDDKPIDLLDPTSVSVAIANSKVFSTNSKKVHKLSTCDGSLTVSKAVIGCVLAVATAPASFMTVITTSLASSTNDLEIGWSNRKENAQMGKLILIVEGIFGAWLLKLKYVRFDMEQADIVAKSNCGKLVNSEMKLTLYETVYLLDSGGGVEDAELLIKKIVESNKRLEELLNNKPSISDGA